MVKYQEFFTMHIRRANASPFSSLALSLSLRLLITETRISNAYEREQIFLDGSSIICYEFTSTRTNISSNNFFFAIIYEWFFEIQTKPHFHRLRAKRKSQLLPNNILTP